MMGLTVKLSHAANPDIAGGYWDGYVDSPRGMHVLAASLKRAQEQVQAYIARNSLGGGNWTGGDLRLDGKLIGRISYNGRAWKLDGTEMDPSDPLLGCYSVEAQKGMRRAKRYKGEEAQQLKSSEWLAHQNRLQAMNTMTAEELASFVVPAPPRSALLAVVTE